MNSETVVHQFGLQPGEIREFGRHKPAGGVRLVRGSPYAAIASVNAIEIWNLARGCEERRINTPSGFHVTGGWDITRSGDRIFGSGAGSELTSVDLVNQSFRNYTLPVEAQAFLRAEFPGIGSFGSVHHPDGTFEDLSRLEAPYSVASSVAVSADESTVAAAYGQAYVLVWDVVTGNFIRCLGAESRAQVPVRIYRVSLSSDGENALTVDTNYDVKLWSVATGQELHRWHLLSRTPLGPDTPADMPTGTTFAGGLGPVSFTPDNTRVVASDGAIVRLWDVASGEELDAFVGHEQAHPIFGDYSHSPRMHDIRFSADGRRALTVGVDCTVRVWDVANAECVWGTKPDPCCVDFADLSDDGNTVIWVGCPGARLYSLAHLDAQGDNAKANPETHLAEQLFRRLVDLGIRCGDAELEAVREVYPQATEGLHKDTRLEMLFELIKHAEDRRISPHPVCVFMFDDPDMQIVSTAALHAAAMWWGSEEDPLVGVREIHSAALNLVNRGDETRAVAMLTGLLSLGDRRITEALIGCWRGLSADGRYSLTQLTSARVHAPLIEWALEWLLECERDEFGAVAGMIAHWAKNARESDGVWEVERALPIWSAREDQVVVEIEQWSAEEYGSHIRSVLLDVAANESAPRVMHHLLREWGIGHSQRLLKGIEMRPTAMERRDLMPYFEMLGDPNRAYDCVRLEDSDFLVHDGDLALCWAIFNPYGPTWMSIGILPTEDPAKCLLFYRMLNPFAQNTVAMAALSAEQANDAGAVGELVARLLQSESLRDECGDVVHLVGGAVPDIIPTMWTSGDFAQHVRRGFKESPVMAATDLRAVLSEMREFQGRPWDRATAQLAGSSKHARDLVGPNQAYENWFDYACSMEHCLPVLAALSSAWHGAIDHAGEPLARTAYTFWQLDDFLSRYQYPIFRYMAEHLS